MLKFPIIKFSIYFIIGIIISFYLNFNGSYLQIGISLGLLSFTASFAKKYRTFGFALTICSFGFICHQIDGYLQSPKPFEFSGIVLEASTIPEKKGKYISFSSKDLLSKNKIQVYFLGNNINELSLSQNLIISKKIPKKVPSAPDEYSFDYKKYLSKKGIHYLLYLSEDEIKLKSTSNLISHITWMRTKIQKGWEKYVTNKHHLEFLNGLILGNSKEIDEVTISYFRDSGAIHILSVSGLHILAAAFLIDFLLKGLLKRKNLAWMYILSVLGFVWMYVLISGFSTAAIRSGIMYSFFVFYKIIGRRNMPINSLFASMLLILIFLPNELFQIGFQLSYAAVFGILILSDFWENIFKPKSKISKQIYPLITAGVAAQLFTLPFILYNFGKFPIYFLFSNLMLILLSNILVIGGLIFSLTSQFDLAFINTSIAFILDNVMEITFLVAKFFAKLPFSVLNIYHFTIFDGLVISLIIFLLTYALMDKNKLSLKLFICSTFLYLISINLDYFLLTKEKIIYKDPNNKYNLIIIPKSEVLVFGHLNLTKFNLQKIENICRKYYISPNHIYQLNRIK